MKELSSTEHIMIHRLLMPRMRLGTGWRADFESLRRGQRSRPVWKRAGIWWMNVVMGFFWSAAAVLEFVNDDDVQAVPWTCAAVVALAMVYPAYRQNRADLRNRLP